MGTSSNNPKKEVDMRKLVIGVATAGALLTAAAVPAMAQIGVYAGPGGFGVGIGAPGPYYDYGGPYAYPYAGYYDYAPGWDGGWYGHPGWHHGYHHWHHR
jgi:hypothetical protein